MKTVPQQSSSGALLIDLDYRLLESNVAYLRGLCRPGQQFIASVKANAYGHGVIGIATALQDMGVEMLATGNLGEARQMRKHGINIPILLFAFGTPEETAIAANEGFIPTVPSLAFAESVSRNVEQVREIYIKIDAGLGRLGIPLDQAGGEIRRIAGLAGIFIGGIYTHVPFVDEPGRRWAENCISRFAQLLAELENEGIKPAVTQVLASSCLMAGLNDPCNAVCVGHALYGLSPYGTNEIVDMSGLGVVLTGVRSRLVHVGNHLPGADLAIGGLYKIEQPRALGIVPVGMSHGIQAAAPGKEFLVLVRGELARVLSVSLEHTVVDLDGIEDSAIGDSVTLVGGDDQNRISLDDLAASWEVLPLEALMRISTRSDISAAWQ